MDELDQIIDEFERLAETASDPMHRLMARLNIKLAEAAQREDKLRQQTIKAIALNLQTQRMLRQMIGQPRKPKGAKHGKAKRKHVEQTPPQDPLRQVDADG